MNSTFKTIKVAPALKTQLLLPRQIIAFLQFRLRWLKRLVRKQGNSALETGETKVAIKLVVDRYNAIAKSQLEPRAIARQMVILLVRQKKILQRSTVVYQQPLSDAAIEAHNCAEYARRLYYEGKEAL